MASEGSQDTTAAARTMSSLQSSTTLGVYSDCIVYWVSYDESIRRWVEYA
jgi:hypothetical protein